MAGDFEEIRKFMDIGKRTLNKLDEKYQKTYAPSTAPKKCVEIADGRSAEIAYFEPSKLYNMLLEYKLNMCSLLVKTLQQCKKFNVYWENDYPGIMVQIEKHIQIQTGEDERIGRNKIMALFAAQTDRIASEEKIPVSLQKQSCSGRNIPTVAVTRNGFRINIGLVPEVYVTKVLVRSLCKLDEIIECFQNSEVKNEMDDEDFFFTEEITIFTVLDLLKDSKGFEITKINTIRRRRKAEEEEEEHKEIRDDKRFWSLIRKIQSGLESNEEQQALCKRSHDFYWQNKKLQGFYNALDDANSKFIECSVKSCNDNESGYGSDSDCEFGIPNEKRKQLIYYSKKITTSDGIGAILLAIQCSKELAGDHSYIDSKFMDYETKEIVDGVWPGALETGASTGEQKKIMYIDLNYCSPNGNDTTSIVDLHGIQKEMLRESGESKNEIIVFDTTSAKTNKIMKAIHLFAPHVNCVLLISDGMKNEQLCADKNPCGTIRIVSSDRARVTDLFEVLKNILSDIDEQPEKLHRIRKEYKRIGATVTTRAICDRSLHFKQRNDSTSPKSLTNRSSLKLKEKMKNNNFYDIYKNHIHSVE